MHCTYLVRADVVNDLTYEDETLRHEYVIFSESAPRRGIPQYLDNRRLYGYLTFGEGHELHVEDDVRQAERLLRLCSDRGAVGIEFAIASQSGVCA